MAAANARRATSTSALSPPKLAQWCCTRHRYSHAEATDSVAEGVAVAWDMAGLLRMLAGAPRGAGLAGVAFRAAGESGAHVNDTATPQTCQ
jgi:hypothetical protein